MWYIKCWYNFLHPWQAVPIKARALGEMMQWAADGHRGTGWLFLHAWGRHRSAACWCQSKLVHVTKFLSRPLLVVSLVTQMVKNPPAMRETWVWSLGWEDPPEQGMATRSSILAWRIPMDSLVGCSPWGHKESDTAECLSAHTQTIPRAWHWWFHLEIECKERQAAWRKMYIQTHIQAFLQRQTLEGT